MTTGPLGQGVANAVGMAIAERFLAERYNRPGHEIVDHRIYAICSDGDLMEGVSQEAASIAGHFGLGKLIYFYDDNHITIDGTTALSFDAEDQRRALRGLRLARPARRRTPRTSTRCALPIARRAGRGRAAVVHRRPLAHRLPRAARDRHGQGARRAARRGRGARDQGGDGLGPRRALLGPRGRLRAHVLRERGVELEAEWRERFDAWRDGVPRRWRRLGPGCTRAGRGRAGAERCRRSRPARRSPRATRARR